jgi:predicted nucleotidyltransferase
MLSSSKAIVDLHPDFKDLLAEFVAADVRFVVLGGYAVGHHGKPRATKDLDLLVSGTEQNLENVAEALRQFGAPPAVIRAARALAPSEIAYLGVDPVHVDIMRRADGVDTESVIDRAVRVDLGGLSVPVISLDDLIDNKRASGRPQDLADLALLEKVRSRTAKKAKPSRRAPKRK